MGGFLRGRLWQPQRDIRGDHLVLASALVLPAWSVGAACCGVGCALAEWARCAGPGLRAAVRAWAPAPRGSVVPAWVPGQRAASGRGAAWAAAPRGRGRRRPRQGRCGRWRRRRRRQRAVLRRVRCRPPAVLGRHEHHRHRGRQHRLGRRPRPGAEQQQQDHRQVQRQRQGQHPGPSATRPADAKPCLPPRRQGHCCRHGRHISAPARPPANEPAARQRGPGRAAPGRARAASGPHPGPRRTATTAYQTVYAATKHTRTSQ